MCTITVCLSVFSFILPPFKTVSYIKCMIIVCLTVFTFVLFIISGGKLHKVHDYCVFQYFLYYNIIINLLRR